MRYNSRSKLLLPLAVAAACLPVLSHAGTAATVRILAVSGEALPDGNGAFSTFIKPVLGDAGQVAFQAFFAGTSGGAADDTGIFFQGAGTDLIQLARKGETAPGGDDIFFGFNRVLVNGAGQVAFFSFYNEPGGTFTGDTGILRYDSGGGLTELARLGQPSPSGKGDLFVFGSGVSWNDSGEIAFLATFTEPGNGASNSGLFIADSDAPLGEIGIQGQASPDGDGSFTGFCTPAINNLGDTAFCATLTGDRASGVFVRRSAGTILPVIRQGQAAPDGNGNFSVFANVGICDSGAAAFIASLSETADGANDNTGIFIGDGSGETVQVARYGQAAPDGNGTLAAISDRSPTTSARPRS